MINAPSLEGIIDSVSKGFFVVDLDGKNFCFSRYTSKKFGTPKINEKVNCYFDESRAYVKKVENEKEEVVYEMKK